MVETAHPSRPDLIAALERLTDVATQVAFRGATTGPQWVTLNAALSGARAALAAEPEPGPGPVKEPIAWRTERGNGLKTFVTERQFRNFRPEAQRWYEPFRCASCAASPHLAEEAKP